MIKQVQSLTAKSLTCSKGFKAAGNKELESVKEADESMLAEMIHLRNENKILQAQLENPSTDRGHQNQTSTTSFMGAGDDIA